MELMVMTTPCIYDQAQLFRDIPGMFQCGILLWTLSYLNKENAHYSSLITIILGVLGYNE